MPYRPPFSLGPTKTAQALKNLLIFIGGLSILSALFVKIHPLHNYLSLSLWGVHHFYIWQFVTHFLFFPCYQIGFSYIIQLSFYLYILWWIGSSIIDRFGVFKFFLFFLSTGFLSGIIALVVSSIGYPMYLFTGLSITIYATIFIWMMINPSAQLMLFFTMPIKARFLVLFIIGFTLFSDLSSGDVVHFITYLFLLIYAYFFSLFFWQGRSGFNFLETFEHSINRLSIRKSRVKKGFEKYKSEKIFDFTSKEATLDEEKFLNAMLEKISLYGEKSLSSSEKKEMEKIMKKKKK